MPSPKTSHQPNLHAFHQLVLFCSSTEGGFHPSSSGITLTALQNKLLAAQKAAQQLLMASIQYKQLAAQRSSAAKKLRLLSTRIGNACIASGMTRAQLRLMRNILNKIQHKHTPGKNPDKKTKTRSQQSYPVLAQLFLGLIDLLADNPLYQPNEEQLKITSLQNNLETYNNLCSQVIAAKTAYDATRLQRNTEFYHEKTGMVPLALQVKGYFRSRFGNSSPQTRRLAKLQFD